MHSWAYSIEGFTATMISELVCVVPYKGEPSANSARVMQPLERRGRSVTTRVMGYVGRGLVGVVTGHNGR